MPTSNLQMSTKRVADNETTTPPSKKPRDERLRDCFEIESVENGEKISCRYCPDFNKTLQKFNPTKARFHLTNHCPGVDDVLRKALLESTQKAKKESVEAGEVMAAMSGVSAATAPTKIKHKPKGFKPLNRPSPAYLSFHTDDKSLDVTAPIENGELLLRLSFPDQLKLNFVAEKNMQGAALAIDGFMNMTDASWSASLCSMTLEGTRAGPHCQWLLNGPFEEGTRSQKVEQLLKVMIMN